MPIVEDEIIIVGSPENYQYESAGYEFYLTPNNTGFQGEGYYEGVGPDIDVYFSALLQLLEEAYPNLDFGYDPQDGTWVVSADPNSNGGFVDTNNNGVYDGDDFTINLDEPLVVSSL